MDVKLTSAAVARMLELNKNFCLVSVKKGGCYGYTTAFHVSDKGEFLTEQDDIKIYVDNDIDVSLVVDYKVTLLQSSFIVTSTDAKTCCCNRSIKIGNQKIDKTQCVS